MAMVVAKLLRPDDEEYIRHNWKDKRSVDGVIGQIKRLV